LRKEFRKRTPLINETVGQDLYLSKKSVSSLIKELPKAKFLEEVNFVKKETFNGVTKDQFKRAIKLM
jgi:DNA-binding transcriptional regulator GbsR (MarR family)